MPRVASPDRSVRPPLNAQHTLLLKWLLFLAVVVCAGLGAWYRGLLAVLWTEDPTGISLGISVLTVLTFIVAGVQVWRLSQVLNNIATLEQYCKLTLRKGLTLDDPYPPLPAGYTTEHLRRVARDAQRGRALDQRLLLDVFEATLRRGHGVVWFTADLLLTLGLVGTVVGFITMLAPLAGLDAGDAAAMKRAIGAMSGGMAVALYTTLAGLVGGVLLRVQGLLLDEAVDEAVRRTTELTELHVVPLLAGGIADAAPAAASQGVPTDAAA